MFGIGNVMDWWKTADVKKRRVALIVLAVLFPVGVIAVTSLAFMVAKGLFALGLAIVLGLGILNFTPVIAMKFANWKLKAIKAEAAANPIESLQNLALQEDEKLKAAATDLAGWDSDNQGMEQGISDYKRDFPGANARTMEETLEKSRECYGIAHTKYLESVASLKLFRVEIQRVDREWQLGIKAGRINQRLFASGKSNAMNDMIKGTALESVRSQLATNMSALSLALAASGKPPTQPQALTDQRQSGMIIDGVATVVPDRQPVSIKRDQS